MKVLHVLNELKFSGAEIMYVDAAPYLQELGCELNVLATTEYVGEYAKQFEKAGYKVFHKTLPTTHNYIKKWIWMFNVIKFIRAEKFDVVHIHAARLRWMMSVCAKFSGAKSVYTFHNVFTCKKRTLFWHKWLRWSAKNIFSCKFQTISDSVYNNEKNTYNNDTTLIYNWYGINRFFPAEIGEKERVRKDLNIKNDTLVFISVGGCSKVKRHHDAIRALALIKETNPNVLYLHLGSGITLNEEISLAKELKVYDNIRFCGNLHDVRKYLIVSDVYIMPSKYEGIPITTIEAMACKIPCVLYNVPGLKDFNAGNEERALIIPESYKILAESIVKIHNDSKLAELLSERARKYVNSRFYLPNNIKQIYALYCS